MGWSGSCGSVGCWWACERGALAASRCQMARRTSWSSAQQWAVAHVLSGEAGGRFCGAVYDFFSKLCNVFSCKTLQYSLL